MDSIKELINTINLNQEKQSKFDLTDPFRLRDFKLNAKNGLYKDLGSASKDLRRLFRYQEEAEENWINGEIADEWYESSGDTYVEESEEIID